MKDFFTIEQATEGLYKEKGSKFLSYAFPLYSEQDIKTHQEYLKKKYFDANHHCYAWVFGLSSPKMRVNDDGEPSHSAGEPILGQIKSFNLTNVLIVVVRYFGGTKLGVGGLVNAYRTAALMALEHAQKKKIFEKVGLKIEFDYNQINVVEKLISDFDLEVKREYREACKIVGIIKKPLLDRFLLATDNLYMLKITIDPPDRIV